MSEPDAGLTSALKDRYRIERELGSGGMATVYLAHDIRHDRPVALKVLRPELAAALGAERFLAEIRTTANLQHPHILGLIDSGEAGGHLFYVMPYVKGESLRVRLQREKQLSVDDAVRIAREVALALDYAHREGVIHRDIKPENILLQDGQAMVSDFGIALAITHAGAERLTSTGLSVGTPQYMSPEQAMGERQLTPRSDVYSLGTVLYEMLAGEPPFTGPTAQAIVSRAMISEPHPITTMRSAVPAHVGVAVHIALKKIAADRFATAQAFADALADTSAALTLHAARYRARVSWKTAAAAAVLVAAGATAGWIAKQPVTQAASAALSSNLSYVLPEDTRPSSIVGRAISADGTTIAYAAAAEGAPVRLIVKRLDSLDAKVYAGTDGASWPFFSPDGAFIGFFADGVMKTLSLRDGSVATITDSLHAVDTHASWGTDGYILFGMNTTTRSSAGIRRVSAHGGAIEVLTRPDSTKNENAHYAPQLLPGTKTFMYVVRTIDGGRTAYRLVAQPLAGGPARTLMENVRHARYVDVDGGRLLYQVDGDVFVARFNARTGTPATGTRVFTGAAAAFPDWTGVAGAILYQPADLRMRTLAWVSRSGARAALPARPSRFTFPSISPDGKRIAVAIRDGSGQSNAWIYDIARDMTTQASTDGETTFAMWTPDGKRLTTDRRRGTAIDLQLSPTDGTAGQEVLFQNGEQLYASSWTSDGRLLVVMRLGQVGTSGLWLLDRENPKAIRPVMTPAAQLGGRLSADNRWISFFKIVDGRNELFVTSFPVAGPQLQVSRDGAREAVWARSGTELFFRSGKQMLAVTVQAGPPLSASVPRVLFEGNFVDGGGGPGNVFYDVALDGRFLMLEEPSQGPLRFNVIQGWERLAK